MYEDWPISQEVQIFTYFYTECLKNRLISIYKSNKTI